jgi:hypothetical protein
LDRRRHRGYRKKTGGRREALRTGFRLFLFILALGLLSLVGLPWWLLPLIALLGGLFFPLPPGQAFVTAFLAGFLLWWGVAFWQNFENQGLLATRVGLLFEGLDAFYLLLVTGTLGGLLAGFGALTGRYAATLKAPPGARRGMVR